MWLGIRNRAARTAGFWSVTVGLPGSLACTYVHGVVLVELWVLLDLAHHDDDGGHGIEDLVAGAFVVLPGRDKVIDALLEELTVDLDVRHLGVWRDEARRWAMADEHRIVVGGRLAMAF